MPEINLTFPLHPRQQQAFETEATELLFGGATSGGKSHFVRVALCIWCLAIEGLQCKLVRKNSDDVRLNHIEGPTGFRALLEPLINLGKVRVTEDGVRFLDNGALITLQHCQDERKLTSSQGVDIHVLVVDEATQISEKLLRFMRTWVRMPNDMKERLPEMFKGMFPRIIYTANPIGVSVGYFRREFVKARKAFSIEKVFGFKRQYIPSLVADNFSADAEETAGRVMGMNDPALARALLEGDWYVPIGDFFPEWDESRHVVPDFTPPAYWFRFRTFDWGTAEPFAVMWWAVSDGETFCAKVHTLNEETNQYEWVEKELWFPRGSLIGYREWYGCNPDNPSQGLRMRNEDIAAGILSRSYDDYEKKILTLTDSFVFPDRGEEGGKTIAKTFEACGVPLTRGRTTRVTGWSQMRSRLIGKQLDSNSDKRYPLIYFCESCSAARDYIPALPRHPHEGKGNDAAEHGEATHICDIVRLACMAQEIVNDPPPKAPDTSKLRNDMTFEQALKQVQKSKRQHAGW